MIELIIREGGILIQGIFSDGQQVSETRIISKLYQFVADKS